MADTVRELLAPHVGLGTVQAVATLRCVPLTVWFRYCPLLGEEVSRHPTLCGRQTGKRFVPAMLPPAVPAIAAMVAVHAAGVALQLRKFGRSYRSSLLTRRNLAAAGWWNACRCSCSMCCCCRRWRGLRSRRCSGSSSC